MGWFNWEWLLIEGVVLAIAINELVSLLRHKRRAQRQEPTSATADAAQPQGQAPRSDTPSSADS